VAETDAAEAVPVGHLDALAEASFYGLPAPAVLGGLDADLATICSAIEVLAGADLTTTFVWVQHLSVVQSSVKSPNQELKRRWLAPLCRGTARAGQILAGVIPGPAKVHARPSPDGDGWIWTGTAPWLSGWTRIDVINASARDEHGNSVWALIDALESETFDVEPLELLAVNASRTVRAHFREHHVPAERVAAVVPEEAWSRIDPVGMRIHAAMALGVAARALKLMGPSPLDGELAAHRAAVDEAIAAPETMPAARAAVSELALRAASANFVAAGARATSVVEHAARLMREAAFMLVFGSRAAIKAALLERLGAQTPDQPRG